ncbi:MAG TPA: sensor domain-containing protein [Gaiellaceae bacterium]|nr:sensor domain-containing protein [Gaiellaceae bacterium]
MDQMSPIGRVLLRPLRARTWRELAFLLLGGVMGIVSFTVAWTVFITGLSMVITLVGIPLLFALAYIDRAMSWIERGRMKLVGETVEATYRRPPKSGVWPLVKTVATDPQTWKDLTWHLFVSIFTFAAGVVALSLWASALWAIVYPFYWSFVPRSTLPELGSHRLDTWNFAIAVLGLGVALAIVTAWLCAALSRAQVSLARLLLAPSDRQRLAARVEDLTRTRAAAADVQAAELQRIERDLHDGAQARLVAVTMELGRARERFDEDPEGARELVESAHREAAAAIVELRELVAGIYPAVLADRGLDAAVSSVASSSSVPVTVHVSLDGRLPAAAEVAAYFVVAEAIANVGKHSNAEHAQIRIERTGDLVVVEVEDDGDGGADNAKGSGLRGLSDRVAALDGRVLVSSPTGGPTVVRAEIPCVS